MGAQVRTFPDSGVLIALYRGGATVEAPAANLLDDSGRIFLSSPFVRHEVSPKAAHNRRLDEYRYYQAFFRRAEFCDDLKAILNLVARESARSGLGAMDSLHIAAAHILRADEFVITERPGKSIYRSSLVKIVYLFR